MPQYAPMVIKSRGGAIPTGDREQQVQKPSVTARYDSGYIREISAAASSRDRDLEDLGDAVGKALTVAGKCVDDYYRGQVNLLTSEYKRQMNEVTDGEDGYMSRLGESAFNLDHEYDLESQRRKEQLLKGKSKYVQGMFALMTKDFDSQHSIRLQQHGMSEFRKFTQAGQNAAIGDALDTMKSTSDVAEFRKNLAMVQYQTTQKYSDMGLSGAALDRAVRMDVSKAMGEAIQAKISQGDQAGAEMLYSLYGGGTTPESKFMGLAGNSGLAPGDGRTIAEACRNPLNLKKPGANRGDRSDFKVFHNYAEGYVGCWRQLQRYQTKNKLFTPRAMIARWAPASDGNDQSKYNQVVASFGIDVDAPIDMSDPRQAALLLKAMSTMEGPVGNMFTSSEIYQMITTGRMPAGREEPVGGPGAAAEAEAGAAPSGGLVTVAAGERQISGAGLLLPDDDARIVRSLEIGRENARRKAEQNKMQAEQEIVDRNVSQKYTEITQMLDDATELSDGEKLAIIKRETSEEALSDMPLQARMSLRNQLNSHVAEQAEQRESDDSLMIGMLQRGVMSRTDWSLARKREEINKLDLSPAVKGHMLDQIGKKLEGKDNDDQSDADLLRYMQWYDSHPEGVTEGEAAVMMKKLNLNAAATKKAQDYRGERIEYSMARINPLIDNALGKKVANKDRVAIRETVLKAMGDQRWTDDQIENWLRLTNVERREDTSWLSGQIPSNCKTLREHYANGTEGFFRPEVSPMTKEIMGNKLLRTVEGWENLPSDARDVIITFQILLEDYNITPKPYPDEEKILRRAGVWVTREGQQTTAVRRKLSQTKKKP